MMKKTISLAMTAIIAIAMALPLSACSSSQSATDTVVINEVVTSNKYSLTASDGSAPDWIELYNGTSSSVNLSGWGLTDEETDQYKFEFPNITLNSGDYLLVYCSGDEQTDNEDGILRTGFKLSSKGEFLALTDARGNTVQAMNLESMPSDISYGRADDGTYLYFGLPTPGAKNEGLTNTTPDFDQAVAESPVKINEYIVNNDYSIVDSDGERSSWVEIINTGSEAVDITGFGLSDDETDTKKWIFPEMSLQPGEIRLVFLSGKDKTDPSGELHANFKLSKNDTKLILSQEMGRTIDVSVIDSKLGSASCGRAEGDYSNWVYFAEPTPGAANTTQSFTEIAQASETYLPAVYLSETKSNKVARSDDPDWIELANSGSEAVDLSGYGLSDSKDEPFRFKFPENTTIQPGEYLVVYCGSLPAEQQTGLLAADISLNADGDDVYLSKPDGSILDTINTGVQYSGITSGRTNGSNERVYFTTATPGAANPSETYKTYTQKPTFSTGGYVDSGYTVEITSEEGASIYYTTDGSKPTTSSNRYSSPISITESTPVRAIAVSEGKLTSECSTENYIIDESHTIPTVCITVNDDEFFGETNGIYSKGAGYSSDEADFPHTGANYWKDIEREISFEWFEADGTKGIEVPAGIKIFGQYSRALDQKSLVIKFRDSYGASEVTYPFFRDYDVTTFNSLILRVSGQDVNSTKLRDAFFAQVCKNYMDLDYMEYRPCAVYINGEYWGLYNLREQLDENYIKNHYGTSGTDNIDVGSETGTASDSSAAATGNEDVDGETFGSDYGSKLIDVVKGNRDVKHGSLDDWNELLEYVRTHDLSDDEAYKYVCSRVDVEEYADYIIAETFFNNTDSGNVRFWRDGSGTNKYRWMLYDLDWGLSPSTYTWNYIEEYFNEVGHGIAHGFSTVLPRALLKNSEWKNYFIERYAYHLTHTFRSERTNAILDQMAEEIRPEMERHIARWANTGSPAQEISSPSSMEVWENNLASLKNMLNERIDIVTEDLEQYFGLSDAQMKELGLE